MLADHFSSSRPLNSNQVPLSIRNSKFCECIRSAALEVLFFNHGARAFLPPHSWSNEASSSSASAQPVMKLAMHKPKYCNASLDRGLELGKHNIPSDAPSLPEGLQKPPTGKSSARPHVFDSIPYDLLSDWNMTAPPEPTALMLRGWQQKTAQAWSLIYASGA